MTANRAWRLAAGPIVALCLLAAWQAVAEARLVPAAFLPTPLHALRAGLASRQLASLTAATVRRMFYGWFVASAVGVALGAAIGMSPRTRAYLEPMLNALRPLPASALIPVGIALFGMSNSMVLAVVGFGALWPMLLATIHGFSAVEPRLYEVARTLGLGRLRVIAKIALPSAAPDILAGMRLGLTTSLVLTIVGEILSGQPGLGQWMLLASRSFRSADLYAGVMVLGLIGYLSARLLGWFESRALKWRPVQ